MILGMIIFTIFVVIPAAEIAGFIFIGGEIGIFPTLLLTLLTAIAGTMLLRYQGFAVMRNVKSELEQGHLPGGELIHGVMILLAALFLIIPGFFTDALGLLLFIPLVRVIIGRLVLKELIRRKATIVEESSDNFHQVVIELDHKKGDSDKEKSDTSEEKSKE